MPDPVMAPLLQYSVLNTAGPVSVVPVPLKPTTTDAPVVEELLAMVSCPVAVPAATGLNCTFKL
jgi:hypothetical protein